MTKFSLYETEWIHATLGGLYNWTIPAYGLVEIAPAEQAGNTLVTSKPGRPSLCLSVVRPSGGGVPFAVNSWMPLASRTKPGLVAMDGFVIVNTTGISPSSGDVIGPQADSFYPSAHSNGLVLVKQMASIGADFWLAKFSSLPLKPFCKFTTTGTFSTSSATVPGTINTQFGYGKDHPGTTGITFNNAPASSNYIFSGSSGAKGIAAWTGSGATWDILNMECP